MDLTSGFPPDDPPSRSTPMLLPSLRDILLVILIGLVEGQGLGPRYNYPRYCTSDRECNYRAGEVCWWLFDGCSSGQCMCDPRNEIADENGHCRPLRLGGEYCTEGDVCIGQMSCENNVCSCTRGKMTSDRRFCQKERDRLLGEACNMYDTCLQRGTSSYVAHDAECSPQGFCRCVEGYKQDNVICRRWNIGESGCTKVHHCQGGALCLDGTCKCPHGYKPVGGNSQCARIGAMFDLGIGEYCDEIDESRYCGYGLVCQRCGGEDANKCVRYLEAKVGAQTCNLAHRHQWSLLLTFLSTITVVLYTVASR